MPPEQWESVCSSSSRHSTPSMPLTAEVHNKRIQSWVRLAEVHIHGTERGFSFTTISKGSILYFGRHES